MLQKNRIIPLEITAFSSDGNGIGRYEGMAVFVPFTAIGDRLEARVVKVAKSHAYGIIERIVTPSPDRTEDGCAVYRRCGGCCMRHMTYEAELQRKAQFVADNLQRIGGITVQPEPIAPSPLTDGYRNKAQYPIRMVDGEVCAGFFARRSHRVISCFDCALQPAFYSDILHAACRFWQEHGTPIYDEESERGLVRHLYLRHAEATGEVMVCAVINGDSMPHADAFAAAMHAAHPGVTTVVLNHNKKPGNVILGDRCTTLSGRGYIRDILCGLEFEISPLSFYQVNRQSAQNLYGIAREYAALTGGETLVDLYCGTGTIGLSMASGLSRLIGVEIIPQAVEDARRNAVRNGVKNAEFFCGDAGMLAARLQQEGTRPDVVVVDPPRKGIDDAVVQAVSAMAPQRVVYISCNSATAARDCARFAEMGYTVRRARAVDLFPRTHHVEAVLLLSRV